MGAAQQPHPGPIAVCDPGVVPIVLVHARALLASTPQGRTAYVDADLRDPAAILDAPELQKTLDLSQPLALLALDRDTAPDVPERQTDQRLSPRGGLHDLQLRRGECQRIAAFVSPWSTAGSPPARPGRASR